MLEELLRILQEESIFHLPTLADRLHTSPDLVKDMLVQLERRGYLKPVAACQPTHCQGCSLAKNCQTAPRLWLAEG